MEEFDVMLSEIKKQAQYLAAKNRKELEQLSALCPQSPAP